MAIFRGKITQIGEVKSGTSAGGKVWSMVEFNVSEVNPKNAQYPEGARFTNMTADNFIKFNKVNDVVDVEYSLSLRESGGKYYMSAKAFKITKVAGANNASAAQPQHTPDNPSIDVDF